MLNQKGNGDWNQEELDMGTTKKVAHFLGSLPSPIKLFLKITAGLKLTSTRQWPDFTYSDWSKSTSMCLRVAAFCLQ